MHPTATSGLEYIISTCLLVQSGMLHLGSKSLILMLDLNTRFNEYLLSLKLVLLKKLFFISIFNTSQTKITEVMLLWL